MWLTGSKTGAGNQLKLYWLASTHRGLVMPYGDIDLGQYSAVLKKGIKLNHSLTPGQY